MRLGLAATRCCAAGEPGQPRAGRARSHAGARADRRRCLALLTGGAGASGHAPASHRHIWSLQPCAPAPPPLRSSGRALCKWHSPASHRLGHRRKLVHVACRARPAWKQRRRSAEQINAQLGRALEATVLYVYAFPAVHGSTRIEEMAVGRVGKRAAGPAQPGRLQRTRFPRATPRLHNSSVLTGKAVLASRRPYRSMHIPPSVFAAPVCSCRATTEPHQPHPPRSPRPGWRGAAFPRP